MTITRRELVRGAALIGGGWVASACGLARPGISAPIPSHVGYLNAGISNDPVNQEQAQAFLDELRSRGRVDGRNVLVDWRYAESHQEQLPVLATELVRAPVQVLVARGAVAALAAFNAGSEVPLVLAGVDDPVGLGLVESLARPGGRVTGLTSEPPGLAAKRLQILLEALPSVKRVGALWNLGEPNRATELETVQKAAAVSGVLVQSLPIDSADQLPPALDLSAQTGCEALLVLPGFLLAALQARIAEYTAQHRLPTMYSTVTRVSSGGLLAYAPDIRDIVRRSAVFVDRILQGARPADLPVEQPDKMSFVVNLHTAAALGVQLPPSVLAQATEVIQ